MSCDRLRELYQAACEVLDDFDNYGEVLQVDDFGEYGKDSAIERLRKAAKAAKHVRCE